MGCGLESDGISLWYIYSYTMMEVVTEINKTHDKIQKANMNRVTNFIYFTNI